MLKNECIVVVGQQPWDINIGSNCKDIAAEFSLHNTVLYVNPPLDRFTSIRHAKDPHVIKRKEIIRHQKKGLIPVSDKLFVLYPDCMVESVNWLKPYILFDFFNKFNNRRFAKVLQQAMEELGFQDFILFNDNEIIKCFYLQELLKPKLSVYYARDYILATAYWRRHGIFSEPKMIAKSDLCFANSAYLMDYCLQYNPKSFDVGQGCVLHDTDVAYTDFPTDMEKIPQPIVGYVGSLQSIRLDINLLLKMARSKPFWSIVLIGPEDEVFEQSALHKCKNVFFLGRKDASSLPAYIASFDVCMNPQSVNQLTVGNYPRKIDEYLMFGKPIVATSTRAMEMFRDYVYLAKTPDEFISQIETALEEPKNELVMSRRKAFAFSHNWTSSVNAMYTHMEAYLYPKRFN